MTTHVAKSKNCRAEGEIEVVQNLVRDRPRRVNLVGDQARDQVHGRAMVSACAWRSRFQRHGHAAAAELS
jgi:hypothetical protein